MNAPLLIFFFIPMLIGLILLYLTGRCLWLTYHIDTDIYDNSLNGLAVKNIASIFKEIVFTKLFLLIFSIIAFIYLLAVLYFQDSKEIMKGEMLSGIAAMLTPVLTYALAGFAFPKDRKLNALLHLYDKDDTDAEERKFIRET